MGKGILLAIADPQSLADVTQALGTGWETTSAATEADVLAQLEKRSFDAVLVDFNLGSPDSSELLGQIAEKRPETVRFLLAYEADLALVAAKVTGVHQLLPKPVEVASLKSRVESGLVPEDTKSGQGGDGPVAMAGGLSAVPSIYGEVLKSLEAPNVTTEHVGKLIARDAALTTELLKLVNSSTGSSRKITDPVKAVKSLGLDTVKAFVMALRFLAEHSHLKPGYLSFEQVWQHSINVAQIARDLVLAETKDRTLASQAFVAGLLHDLGKVVLVANFDDLYGRVHSLARKQPVTLWDVEKEMFGASHGEIGACLVGMWNMPAPVVEAAALHHEPPLGEHDRLTPLAAVHIANVLENELRPDDDCMVAPVISTPLLNELGLLQRLPVWRAACGNRAPASGRAARTNRTGNQMPAPASATRTGTLGQLAGPDRKPSLIDWRNWRRPWVYAGLAAGVLGLLAFWFNTEPEFNSTEPIYARTPVVNPAPVAESRPSVPPAPATVPEITSAPTVSEELPSKNTSASMEAKQAVSEPAVQLAPIVASQPIVTNAAPAQPPPPKPAEHRLNGIIYSVARPSAIINGETVYVGDYVNGAKVIGIGRSNVILQVNGQRKTYALH